MTTVTKATGRCSSSTGRLQVGFAVKNFGVSCLTSIFNLINLKMKILQQYEAKFFQHTKNWFKLVSFDYSYTNFYCCSAYKPVL